MERGKVASWNPEREKGQLCNVLKLKKLFSEGRTFKLVSKHGWQGFLIFNNA
jgi:hypothetical protein